MLHYRLQGIRARALRSILSMTKKVEALAKCTTRIDFLNLIFPGSGTKNKYLEVIFSLADEDKYNSFTIPKKRGGSREILAPIDDLLEIQRALSKFLMACYHELYGDIGTPSHAFLKGKSIISNAKQHKNKNFVLNIDLENFFPSITFGRIRNYFIKNNKLKVEPEVATLIAKIACYKGFLPQGSPSSPIISNFICQILDYKLIYLAKKTKCHYTRYADDITFSTNLAAFPKELAFWENDQIILSDILVDKIARSGFKINHNKTRIYDKYTRQEVTSLTVNKKVNVSRKYFDDTKAMAHKYYKEGNCTISGKPGDYHKILGRFNFINQLEKYNNKLIFKKNEKNTPKNILSNGKDVDVTKQSKQANNYISLTNNSKNHLLIKYHVGYDYLSARERAYSTFLYYSTFIINEKPLILVEGQTDILYLKSALKNLYKKYPELIEKKEGVFNFKVSFYKQSKLKRYLLNISPSGAGILEVLKPKYLFPQYAKCSSSPVIILLDNEPIKGNPLGDFNGEKDLNNGYITIKKGMYPNSKCSQSLLERLQTNKFFLLVTPKNAKEKKSDIECLFKKSFTDEVKFSRSPKNGEIGKEAFSKIVEKNYKTIDFSKFIPLLDNLKEIIEETKK